MQVIFFLWSDLQGRGKSKDGHERETLGKKYHGRGLVYVYEL